MFEHWNKKLRLHHEDYKAVGRKSVLYLALLQYKGLSRDSNPGPLAPEASIIPLDHWALDKLFLQSY